MSGGEERQTAWKARAVIGVAAVAAVSFTSVGVAMAVTSWSPVTLTDTHTVTHGDPIQQVLAQQLLCGAEVAVTWEMTSSDGVAELPDVLAGRELTGVVHAAALACSQAAPVVTREPDGTVSVLLEPPSVVFSWVDPSRMRPPRQDRGLWDRVSDTWDAALGDGGNGIDAYHGWLTEAEEAVLEQIAETDALEVAEEQIRAVVVTFATAVEPGVVVDVQFGAASSSRPDEGVRS